jgi:hypothetical protein
VLLRTGRVLLLALKRRFPQETERKHQNSIGVVVIYDVCILLKDLNNRREVETGSIGVSL